MKSRRRLLKTITRTLVALLLIGLGYGISEWLATPPSFDLSEIEFPRALRE